nr:uncharacterized protein CI109_003739 [Kwoniella shandongensis]KAA5527768.1 hypothetical protein CI109_003739 [Kwoniella shandongensis]
MESVAGLSGGSGDGDGDDEERERIAKEVRCEGCGGGFCVAHRAQTSHSCSAPLIHEKRYDAFLSRRTQAQEILAQHFPEQVGRVIPKPPPGREVIKKRPKSPERSPPSVQATLSSSSTSGLSTSNENATAQTSSASKKPKTKAEKLWEIQIRKIKMGAKPLSPTGSGSVADDEKRFFEWGVDLERKGVKGWKDGGKWTGKVERVWIGVNTPVGKVMDLIIAQAKVPRPKSDDPAQALGLLSLYPPPDGERTVTPLELSKSVGQAIQEGSMIVLIRGEV